MAFVFFLAATETPAQVGGTGSQVDLFSWWNISLFLMVVSLIGAIYYRFRVKEAEEVSAADYKRVSYSPKSAEKKTTDSDKDPDWGLAGKQTTEKEREPKKGSQSERKTRSGFDGFAGKTQQLTQEELNEMTAVLPIFSFHRLKPTKPFAELPTSNDPALMSAIEQVQDEFEEDEEVRALAVRILAAFRTSNSVEALSPVALYDLSTNLRSKALNILSEFDHESIFETILLGCADPTREVRAAAARALFHLTFNRADAWVRIADSGEEGRMLQAARAAVEGDLVERSFERLAHPDSNMAYEAFALVSLLIRTGETDSIFDFLRKKQDIQVRRSLLHTLKVSKDKKALDGLKTILEEKNLNPEFQEEIDKTIEEMGFVMV
ncbi:MAG: hypothetical protein R2747_19430 [Pyrinomonadaceae bacterium]